MHNTNYVYCNTACNMYPNSPMRALHRKMEKLPKSDMSVWMTAVDFILSFNKLQHLIK